jgi:glycine cleavage system aminomethyltransferase T/glycine/D-amino acid oxidase-like deaminating enzyme
MTPIPASDHTPKALPDRARVVVLGGGIIGASTLYHLAKNGVTDAVLLERDRIASGTTWHAAGIVVRLRDNATQTALANYTCDLFGSLEAETGQATGYRQNGSMAVALNPLRLEYIKRSVSAAKRLGVSASYLTPGEVKERWPLLNVEDVLGGMVIPSNGQVNPYDVTMALIKGARMRGTQVFENTPVEDVLIRKGKVVGVRTTRGDIECERVLVAAGMWTQILAKRLGVPVPLQAAEHYYLITEGMANLPRDTPALSVTDERTYYKEDAGKLLFGSFERVAKPWPPEGEQIPETFSFQELPPDMAHMEPQLELAFGRVPALQDIGIKLFFCGPESFTSDGQQPFMGPATDVRGLYLAAGMNSNGIIASGGAGKVMAAWMMDGIPPNGMGSMHAQRAMAFQSNSRYVRDRVVEAVGVRMTLHWPGHHLTTARGIRHFPLHDRLLAAGAVMGERVGWEIPLYYAEPGASLPHEPSMKYQAWFPHLTRECLAARDAAVLIDQSCYGKLLISGPDVVTALNHVSANEMDVPVGRSVYTHWLNARGGIEADVILIRIAEESYLLITGPASQERDRGWFLANIESGWNVQIHDVTANYGMFALSGPRAREILQSLTDVDLCAAALPFGHARLIDIGYGRAWVLRRSFVGETGFEIFPTTDLCRHVYGSLLKAGQPRGMVPAGFLAMLHCRLEKGFVHFGNDIAEDDTPLEAGLRFAVAFDKPGGFIGQEALVRQRDAGPLESRLVSLRVRNANLQDGPYLYRGEPLWKGGAIVGYVTSGGWGFRLDQSLGMASVRRPGGVSAEWLREGGFEVEVAGELHVVDLQFQGFYDPKGERLRG